MSTRCLIISHAFNMDGRAASQTVTDKIPYFIQSGWKIYVLSAATGQRDDALRHGRVWGVGPSALRFDFRHWCALRWGRNWRYKLITQGVSLILLPLIVLERIVLGLSSQWSWGLTAAFVGYRWHKRYGFDLIYTSGGAWSAHLAGWWLKKSTGLPWIAELHDPLVVRKNRQAIDLLSGQSRENFAKEKLEKIICTDSDLCWWFTEGALRYAKLRNPSLGDKGFSVLPGSQAPASRLTYTPSDAMHINYFGSLSNSRTLASLIKALSRFFSQNRDSESKIKINIYGGTLDSNSLAAIKFYGLQRTVVSHGRLEYDPITQLSGREQISQLMQKSDYLLLLHGEEPVCSEYIPSKLYEYWWAQRPIFALIHENNQLGKLIEEISELNVVSEATADCDVHFSMIHRAWEQWKSGRIVSFETNIKPLGPEVAVEKIINRVESHIALKVRGVSTR